LIKHRKEIDVIYFVAPDAALSAVLAKLFGKKVIINADGIEWLRVKKRLRYVETVIKPLYYFAQLYMYIIEMLSCRIADVTIADSAGIKMYLEKIHHASNVVHIAYGARRLLESDFPEEKEREILEKYELISKEYFLTVARIVPENNIEMGIEGFLAANSTKKMVVVGDFNLQDPYAQFLQHLKKNDGNIFFLDSIYNKEILGVLRKNCFAYIHAYEVGGTNPSLLEQMCFQSPIFAYDVSFNKEVLGEGGIFIKDSSNLAENIKILENGGFETNKGEKIRGELISKKYNWDTVTDEYFDMLKEINGKKLKIK
jgi:glycosyltransferase involved in cell wall biosynthesis